MTGGGGSRGVVQDALALLSVASMGVLLLVSLFDFLVFVFKNGRYDVVVVRQLRNS